MTILDIKFWGAVLGATIIKVVFSEDHTWKSRLFSVVCAMLLVIALTDPVLDFWDLDAEVYGPAVGGLLALLGDSIVRWVLTVTPEKAIDIWRGKKK